MLSFTCRSYLRQGIGASCAGIYRDTEACRGKKEEKEEEESSYVEESRGEEKKEEDWEED